MCRSNVVMNKNTKPWGRCLMKKCKLAVDIGASNGRIIAGYMEEGKLKIEEIHRFPNRMEYKNGHYCWNVDRLFAEIKEGIKKCPDKGFDPESIGIDTWGVDFVLLDGNDQLLTDAVAYRDPRTDGMMEEVLSIVPKELLYSKTGIQFQKFNTVYQLYYLKKHHPEILEKAKTFLMIPDYLNFLLTGKKVNEYTNATTTQLVNAFTKDWDKELLNMLGIKTDMFQSICPPKTSLGTFKPELEEELGFNMEVILPATHDTGSAVLAVPEWDESIYISSGTWSLIGVENDSPVCRTEALTCNFTNEGGFDFRFRILKNIMGLWMIQEVKRLYNDQYSYREFLEMARKESHFHSVVNVDDERFLKPDDMIEEIQKYCQETKQQVPTTPGEIAKCIFESLAVSYQKAVDQIEKLFQKEYKKINVIGGGSQNDMLNHLITVTTGKEVVAGPQEATAIGNLAAQFLAKGEWKDVLEARRIIRTSFPLKVYKNLNEAGEEGYGSWCV